MGDVRAHIWTLFRRSLVCLSIDVAIRLGLLSPSYNGVCDHSWVKVLFDSRSHVLNVL
jgi:hypothetical protein